MAEKCGVRGHDRNLSYYPRRGYVETHRAGQDGFRRVYFRNPLD